jgi:hypothetical protein
MFAPINCEVIPLQLQYIWRDADRDCRSKGMSLVSMHSQEEINAINFVLCK